MNLRYLAMSRIWKWWKAHYCLLTTPGHSIPLPHPGGDDGVVRALAVYVLVAAGVRVVGSGILIRLGILLFRAFVLWTIARLISSGAGRLISSGAGLISSGAGLISSGAGRLISSGAGQLVHVLLVDVQEDDLDVPRRGGGPEP